MVAGLILGRFGGAAHAAALRAHDTHKVTTVHHTNYYYYNYYYHHHYYLLVAKLQVQQQVHGRLAERKALKLPRNFPCPRTALFISTHTPFPIRSFPRLLQF